MANGRAKLKKEPSAKGKRRWSNKVTRESNALDLEPGVFTKKSPRAIAQSLKRSADRSLRRKAEPFRSAMSMLTFFVNRAGSNLTPEQHRVLEEAKGELRRLYGRKKRHKKATADEAARPSGQGQPG